MQFLAREGMFDSGLKIRPLIMPDEFIDQDKPEKQYELAGLNAANIVAAALSALGKEEAALTSIRA